MNHASIFGIRYSATDYQEATDIIIEKAVRRESYGVSALAVHGLIESYKNSDLKSKVNKINMVVPDGQPVRWAINSFHNADLKDRVYGPDLTKYVLQRASQLSLKVYLYGSTSHTLKLFSESIERNYPGVEICGIHEDRFRDATPVEDQEDIIKINKSGANIVLVGRGCPRQEIWVADHLGKIEAVMMAVGAAFDFHAGTVSQAPKWMQDRGLEWFYRLYREPGRLWKRYLFTNSFFIYLFFKHKFFMRRSN